MQLTEIKEIQGKIVLRSGLRIGAGDVEMKIGGTDNPVIRHPNTQEPYIPGSSIKGKIRSLLELRSGLMGLTRGGTLQPKHLQSQGISEKQRKECEKILKIFGSSGADSDESDGLGPTRVSFADCPITNEWRARAREERLSLFEVKSENRIDRIKGTAEHPRSTERVPAETEFAFSVCLKILQPEEGELLTTLLEGLKLLELDALGGSGSRGYGKIRFKFTDSTIQEAFDKTEPFGNGGDRP